MASIYLLAAQVLWVRGEMEDALEILARAEQAAQRLRDSRALAHVQAFRARLALARGDLAQAEAWSQGIDSTTLVYEHEVAYLVLARLHLARQGTDEALTLLGRLHAADAAANRTGNVISVLALLALAYQQARQPEQALRALDRLLALAEPEGYIRVFVDEDAARRDLLAAWLKSPLQRTAHRGKQPLEVYVQRLLAAFPLAAGSASHEDVDRRTADASPLIEPLSTREQDVLELLAAGLSNAQMAAQLVVTVGTIKTHIKSIYGKLGVHSRVQAVARAREVGLL
jgi:LuxR family maltose regulon positive regulatory protein